MEVTDANGRKIVTKEIDPGDLFNIIEAAGGAAENKQWMRLAMVVCSVTEIDGIPVPMSAEKKDIVALARKIGNSGLVALQKALFGDDEAPAKTDAEQVAAAKN